LLLGNKLNKKPTLGLNRPKLTLMKTTSTDQNESTSSSASFFSSTQNTPTDQFETKYKKHEVLGAGCSSTAYACTKRNNLDFSSALEEKIEDNSCETKLCVKVTKFTDEAKLPACQNEFSLLQSLSHPAIVKCHDFYPDQVNNQCLTVLDRIKGTGLDQISCGEK
jgi:serine/threonine protein kinase